MTSAPPRVSAWNVANGLTALRLVLVPVCGWLLLASGHVQAGHWTGMRLAAAAAFFVAGCTDLLDGELARRHGLITDIGKIADPIADKALTGMALVGLSVLGELSWWVTVVIMVREVGVTLLRFWVLRYGVIPANRGGKAKTAAQAVAILLYLLPLPAAAHRAAVGVMLLAVLLTVISGADYVMQALRLRAAAGRAPTPGTLEAPAPGPGSRP